MRFHQTLDCINDGLISYVPVKFFLSQPRCICGHFFSKTVIHGQTLYGLRHVIHVLAAAIDATRISVEQVTVSGQSWELITGKPAKA